MRTILGLLLAIALPSMTLAQTAYVTDSLRLGLHRAADTSDSAFRMLESGQTLEIVTRDRNYAQVRMPDGTVGYVKAAYLVTDPPAKLIVNNLKSENESLQQRLTELNAAFSQPAATIEKLEAQVSESGDALAAAQADNADLRRRVDTLESRQDAYKNSLPVSWVSAALAVVLLAGFLGGLWWTDFRSRQRHGGIRIY